MKLQIARNENNELYLYSSKPIRGGDGNFYLCETDSDDVIRLNDEEYKEVTYENSPQEVEIVLPKTHNKVWHDIDEEPIYVNGTTPLIIDSNYGHISQEGHYYDQFQWKHHIESQKHREFKWAYEKDLMNL